MERRDPRPSDIQLRKSEKLHGSWKCGLLRFPEPKENQLVAMKVRKGSLGWNRDGSGQFVRTMSRGVVRRKFSSALRRNRILGSRR